MSNKEKSADLVELLKSQCQEYDENEGIRLLQFGYFQYFCLFFHNNEVIDH